MSCPLFGLPTVYEFPTEFWRNSRQFLLSVKIFRQNVSQNFSLFSAETFLINFSWYYSDALSSGQLGPALAQFGVSQAAVDAANKGDVRAFAAAMEKDQKKDENEVGVNFQSESYFCSFFAQNWKLTPQKEQMQTD